MKKTRKVLSAVAVAAMVAVTAVPVTPVQAAVSPVKAFTFDDLSGLSSSGISGATAPTIVEDGERGKVLKFANGSASKYIGKVQDPSMADYDMKIVPGTPSSLKFANPYKGKSLSGITIALWVKVPSEEAAVNGAGLVGFVSGTKTMQHPDKRTGDPDKQSLADGHGPYVFGITTAYYDDIADKTNPMVYFAGLHHNSYNFGDLDKTFNQTNTWKYMVVSMTNSDATVYIDGKQVEGNIDKNKRWNHGEERGNSEGNKGEPVLTDMLAWDDTQAYLGYTGFSPTYEVSIDDLQLFDKPVSASEANALYADAKAGKAPITGTDGAGGGSGTDAAAAAAAARAKAEAEAAAAEAAAQEANKNLTNAVLNSVEVTGMPSSAVKNVTGIFRGESAYTELQNKLNSVTLRSGYRVANFVALDINFNGVQPEALATVKMNVPDGFDTSKMEVVRVNDDGTVSILKYTIEDGKIVTKTNHFSKFAIVQLEEGVYKGGSSSNLPKTGVVSTGIVVAFGAAAVAGGAVLLKKKREVEA